MISSTRFHNQSAARRRNGFSLLELLVAIGVISLLLALIVPAIQFSRETARRIDCQNRQHQLAIAIHNFDQAHGHLPGPVVHLTVSPIFPKMLSEWARLLPYLDQESLSQQIDFDVSESPVNVFSSQPALRLPANQQLLRTNLPAVVCPSDRFVRGACNLRVCRGTFPRPRRNDSAPESGGRKGVFPAWPMTRAPGFKEVVDGLSNTMMISERIVGDLRPAQFSQGRDFIYLVKGVSILDLETADEMMAACASVRSAESMREYSYSGATWLLGGQSFTAYDHIMPPNAPVMDCVNNSSPPISAATATARSGHAGGVNGTMADGSSRFVSNNIDINVWRAMGTRAGHEATQ